MILGSSLKPAKYEFHSSAHSRFPVSQEDLLRSGSQSTLLLTNICCFVI
ncbi:hypothetical protein HMPREF9610_02097 [Cutibacterium acnes HL027PA2]|nr:hypothetical protein HMPREF9610_02097 [Cutibacterium acnes HL027PA2]